MKKKTTHRKSQGKISLGIVAGLAPTVYYTIKAAQTQGMGAAVSTLEYQLLGYSDQDNKVHLDALIKGWTPILGGIILHKIANKTGLNRALSGIPFVNI
jgi:hypothetical protein